MSEEKRWIILADDGRHVTVGRHTAPSEEEIAAVGRALAAGGNGGWLAVTEGVYYSRSPKLGLIMVREVAPPRATWDEAAAAFHTRRRDAVRPRRTVEDPSGPSDPS